MGFKVRDKSLFWTKSGWKNNWEPKIGNTPRPIISKDTAYVSCRYDHHSYLRSTFPLIQWYNPIEIIHVSANNICMVIKP